MSTPELACELNELWASEGRPYRLGKHGIAQLWAIRSARGEAGQPLLFIVGREERAVLLSGRADILFPSYFVNADRR